MKRSPKKKACPTSDPTVQAELPLLDATAPPEENNTPPVAPKKRRTRWFFLTEEYDDEGADIAPPTSGGIDTLHVSPPISDSPHSVSSGADSVDGQSSDQSADPTSERQPPPASSLRIPRKLKWPGENDSIPDRQE